MTGPVQPASAEDEAAARGRPRRSPAAGERVRDAEASRRRLLAAAAEEFSVKGFTAARVQDIADRAGVNKQLVSYYFGSKEGLYRALAESWRQREAALADPQAGLEELVVGYLREALADPRLMRLLIWRGLSGEAAQPTEADPAAGLVARQRRGELAADLDPRAVLVALTGMVAAPIALPQRVAQITGLDPASGEFVDFYASQLRVLVRHLTGDHHPGAEAAGDPDPDPDTAPTEGGIR